MTDIHCHILPFVDDGAEDMAQALAMARMAYDSGVTTLVATPHCNLPGTPWKNYASHELLAQFIAFRTAVEEAGIPLKIKAGAEVFATEDMVGLLRRGKLLTLASSDYLLMEFHFDETGAVMDELLRCVAAEGLTPVVAHPERYEAVQYNPALAARWFERGYVIQLNKGSVLGRFGRRVAGTAGWLLERGLAHVVASDAHSSVSRTTDMSQVQHYLVARYSPAYAEILMERNPERVVENRPMV